MLLHLWAVSALQVCNAEYNIQLAQEQNCY